MSETVIEAGRTGQHYWADLWRYRELAYFLVWRDLAVLYKQTAIGVAWAVIRPVLTTAILVVAFGKIAQLPSGNVPYPVLVLAAIIPWSFFAAALGESSASLVGNANLVSKVYFPRIILPTSAAIVGLVDCLICIALLVPVMAWYGYAPTWRVAALPALMVLAFVTALGPGLLVSALNVKYRDFRYVVPFLLQLGLYLSPVGFPSALVAERFGRGWLLVYSLNPMVGVIDGFRWAICGDLALDAASIGVSGAVSLALLFAGIHFFRRTERGFADVI